MRSDFSIDLMTGTGTTVLSSHDVRRSNDKTEMRVLLSW